MSTFISPNTVTLHVDHITTEVRRLARQQPERTTECSYVGHDSKPQCIIGHACHALGVSTFVLGMWEGFPVLDLDFQGDSEWLQQVQNNQDAGACWALAVSDADAFG